MPRRRRPSGWWFVLGGGLLLAAAVVGVALFVWTLRGFLATDATVPADGEPHRVRVGEGPRMLWLRDGTSQQCALVDLATGDPVRRLPLGGDFQRSTGSGDFHGALRFDPGSGRLEVTCTASGGRVEIGPAPRIETFVGGILATLVVPLLLGGAGVLVLVVTTVLFATGAPRRAPGPGA